MKLMKSLAVLITGLALSAQAGNYAFSSFVNGVQLGSTVSIAGNTIPDGNLSGWASQQTLADLDVNNIQSVSVKLNLSGGFNGDLYAYLSYGNILVPLLNRSGVGTINGGTTFGYADSGMNVAFTGHTGSDIHWYQGNGSITDGSSWVADGRTISPLSSPSAFNTASRLSLDAYQGLNPNGGWTLFIADVSGGGGSPTINSWELDITAVPEPVNLALGAFGAALGLLALCRTQKVRGLFQKSVAA